MLSLDWWMESIKRFWLGFGTLWLLAVVLWLSTACAVGRQFPRTEYTLPPPTTFNVECSMVDLSTIVMKVQGMYIVGTPICTEVLR